MTARAKFFFWLTIVSLAAVVLVQAVEAFRWSGSHWLGFTLEPDNLISIRYPEDAQPPLRPLLEHAPLAAQAVKVEGAWRSLRLPGDTRRQPYERMRDALGEAPLGEEVLLRIQDAGGAITELPLTVSRVEPEIVMERWGVYTSIGSLLAAFALWVYYSRPGSPEALAFAVAFVIVACVISTGQVTGSFPTRFLWIDYLVRNLVGPAVLMLGLRIAPRPWFDRKPWVYWLPLVLPIGGMFYGSLYDVWDRMDNLPQRVVGGITYTLFIMYMVWARWNATSTQEKRRLELYLVALPLGFIVLFVRFVLWTTPATTYHMYTLLVIPAAIGYGILKHRLFDIEVTIRRGLGYAALGVVSVAVYAVLTAAAYALLGSWEAASSTPLTAAFVATGIAVGASARSRLQRLVDRGVNPERYRALEALRRARERLASMSDEQQAADSLVQASTELAGLSGAALYLDRGGRYLLVARSGRIAEPTGTVMGSNEPLIGLASLVTSEIHRDDFEQNPRLASVKRACVERMEALGAEFLLPLRHSGKGLLGLLALGPRADSRPVNSEDLEMLKALASEAALAVERSRSRPESAPTARLGSRPAVLETGVRLGRYRLERLLGRGGMGDVYLAEDENLHREVALKFIREGGKEGATLDWLRREARVLASLSHPNIMQIFALEEEGGHTFLVAERLEGPPLDEELEEKGPFPAEETLAIGRQVAEALGYAWDKGVIHRDVKPANIMRAGGAVVKLTDFGLARPEEAGHSLTGGGGILGTPTYIAPEMFGGEKASYRTDMYALGMVLHMLRTGEPARGKDGSVPWYATSREPDLTGLGSEGNDAVLRRVISKLIARRPGDRYATYSDMIRDLRSQA